MSRHKSVQRERYPPSLKHHHSFIQHERHPLNTSQYAHYYDGYDRNRQESDDATYGCSVEGPWQQSTPTLLYGPWQGCYQLNTSSAYQGQMVGYSINYAADFKENIYLYGQETTVPVPVLRRVPVEPSRPQEKQDGLKRKRREPDDDTQAHDDCDDNANINDNKTGKKDKQNPSATTSLFDKTDDDLRSANTLKIREEIARGKNRLSTRKCRNRKQIETANLTSNEQTLEDINRNLTICAKELTEEVCCLKMQLLQHADCQSEMIQDYIKLEAEKFVLKQMSRKSYSVGMNMYDECVGGWSPAFEWTGM